MIIGDGEMRKEASDSFPDFNFRAVNPILCTLQNIQQLGRMLIFLKMKSLYSCMDFLITRGVENILEGRNVSL